MSAILPKIYTLLSGNAPVIAVSGTRIYPVEAPQKADTPYITFQRISGTRATDMSGDSGLEFPRVQMDCWADSLEVADDLSTKVLAAMMGASTFSVSDITSPMDDEEDGTYRVTRDYLIINQET